MKWLEKSPIPKVCENCAEEDCYNCDVAGERWVLSKEEELHANRKLMVRAIERLERKIAEIDAQLESLGK
ncbi:MAG: hypothetical protein IJZ15_03425 [Oscillospiraceae bacterium]|nr:hypothetical protein [Oscillospiraceae bacterium]